MRRQYPAVYVLTNHKNRPFHVGLAEDLPIRMQGYRQEAALKLEERYGVHKLVYYEYFDDSFTAAARALQLKEFSDEKMLATIRTINPDCIDLYDTLF